MARRRNNGEGSITYRDDKDLWVATVQVGYKPDGTRKRKTLYGKTKSEVLQKKKEIEAQIVTNTFVEYSDMTLESYLDKWLAQSCEPRLRPKTVHDYRGLIDNHIKTAIGKIKLKNLKPIHLQELYNAKRQEGLSPRTVQLMHSILHRAFAQAINWDLMPKNVADRVDKPTVPRKTIQVLDEEQVARFLQVAEDDRYFALYVLALTTGMRQGEILGLSWRSVDLSRGILEIQQALHDVQGKLYIGDC